MKTKHTDITYNTLLLYRTFKPVFSDTENTVYTLKINRLKIKQ